MRSWRVATWPTLLLKSGVLCFDFVSDTTHFALNGIPYTVRENHEIKCDSAPLPVVFLNITLRPYRTLAER